MSHNIKGLHLGWIPLLASTLLAIGCGGGGGSKSTMPASNPVPTVTSLSPASLLLASASQTLTITGTNFVSTSPVSYNGATHPATYASATQMTLDLTAANLAAAGE